MQLRGVSVGYKSRRSTSLVLSDLNLDLNGGEVTILLGANGGGKSTLLRTLARSQPPLFGRIEIEGRDIARLPQVDLAKNVGLVLTDKLSLGAMTALELVELGRYPYTNWAGSLTKHDEFIARQALDLVGAAHLATRSVDEMSDGERQRVTVARALAQQPKILVLDEPTAFLDVTARAELLTTLRNLARTTSMAVVLSCHDLDLALRTADVIWLLNRRGDLDVGAPEDLIENGTIGAVFSSPLVAFSAADRTVVARNPLLGTACVIGPEPRIRLASTLLQREGFAPSFDRELDGIQVVMSEQGWKLTVGDHEQHGTSYEELGRSIRFVTSTTAGTENA